TARHNRLFPFLESQGYQFINYGFFDFPGLPSRGKPFFGNDYFEDVLGNQTIISRYNRDIRWYVASRNFLKGGSRVPPYFIRNKRDHIARHDAFFKGLKNELDREAGQPRFVYVHFLLPHQPFYQDSTGREVPHQVILKSSMTVEEGYLQQVGYVNRMLRQLAPSMVKPSARKRVVIIQGDHGYRLFDRTVSQEKVFSNLNAIYFSDGGYDQLHDSMSCVNTFRFVLNRYFRQDLAILRDSSRYFRDPEIEGRRKNLKN
ncbi:MAG TPA: sulfatase-like hydrolase/transferase, partial [Flavisolibacter sp.]